MEADIASQAVGLTSTDFSIVQLFLRADIIVKSVIIILIAGFCAFKIMSFLGCYVRIEEANECWKLTAW